MTYNEFIQNIIDTRGQWNIPEGEYYENHHILPKCMGGEPQSYQHATKHDNLIWLTAKEHYEAHKLLALEYPDNDKLQDAWWQISTCRTKDQDRYTFISAEEYEESRKRHSQIQSSRMMGENNPNYGKPKSDVTKQKLSDAHKGKPAWNKGVPMSEEQKVKLSQARTGKFDGKDNVKSKPVLCVETGEIFESIRLAGIAKCQNKNRPNPGSDIGGVCRGLHSTAYGYHWQYIEK